MLWRKWLKFGMIWQSGSWHFRIVEVPVSWHFYWQLLSFVIFTQNSISETRQALETEKNNILVYLLTNQIWNIKYVHFLLMHLQLLTLLVKFTLVKSCKLHSSCIRSSFFFFFLHAHCSCRTLFLVNSLLNITFVIING